MSFHSSVFLYAMGLQVKPDGRLEEVFVIEMLQMALEFSRIRRVLMHLKFFFLLSHG
jgi:hypothetical protein